MVQVHLTRQHWLLVAMVIGAVVVGLVVALLPTSQSTCIGGGPGQLGQQCIHHQPDWPSGVIGGIAAYIVEVAFVLSVRVLSRPH